MVCAERKAHVGFTVDKRGINGGVTHPQVARTQPQATQGGAKATAGANTKAKGMTPVWMYVGLYLSVVEQRPRRLSVRVRCWMVMRIEGEERLCATNPSPWSGKGGDNNVLLWEPCSAIPGCVGNPKERVISVNLVDPASSHMLRSRAKPCTSQRKWCNSGSVNGSLHQQSST